jgi:alpha-N-arabinofuranosidase
MYGEWQIGGMSAVEYVAAARRYAKIMLRTDASIELVSCGQWGFTDWDRIVLEGLADLVRYHSIHIYTGAADYLTNVLQPHQADRALRICEAFIEQVRYTRRIRHPIGIAYDEWNVWYRTRTPEGREGGLEERYDLSDALAVASFLNVFVRHCRSVEMANIAQLVNVIAPVFTRPDGLFQQTIYHPFRLYAELTRAIALDAHVASPTLSMSLSRASTAPSDREWDVADLGPFQALDVVATRDEDRRGLTVAVINRHPSETIEATLDLGGAGGWSTRHVYEVNSTSPGDTNSFAEPTRVRVQERSVDALDTYTFPAHSLTVLHLENNG